MRGGRGGGRDLRPAADSPHILVTVRAGTAAAVGADLVGALAPAGANSRSHSVMAGGGGRRPLAMASRPGGACAVCAAGRGAPLSSLERGHTALCMYVGSVLPHPCRQPGLVASTHAVDTVFPLRPPPPPLRPLFTPPARPPPPALCGTSFFQWLLLLQR